MNFFENIMQELESGKKNETTEFVTVEKEVSVNNEVNTGDYVTVKELSKILNVSDETVRTTAKALFDPSKLLWRVVNGGKSMFFTQEQATMIKVKLRSRNNLKWFSIEELSKLSGLGIDRLNQLLPSLCNGLQSETYTSGKEHRKFYSETILNNIKEYCAKTSVPNATKEKDSVIRNNVNLVGEMAINKTFENIISSPTNLIALSAILSRKLAEMQMENAEQKQQLQEQAPKVDFYNTVTQSDDMLDFAQVAKLIGVKGIGRNNLIKFLIEQKVLISANRPFQKYVNQGYFKIVETKYFVNNEVKIGTKTVVSQSGVDFINRLLNKHELKIA